MRLGRRVYSVIAERLVASSATVPAVPKYLVVKQKEGDFKKVSTFFTDKAVTGSLVQNIRKAAGGVLVETLNDQQG